MSSAADQLNERMVDRLIAGGALWSPGLVASFRATPRHRFLDRVFQFSRKNGCWREVITRDAGTEELKLVYSDQALITRVISCGTGGEAAVSSSSQPSLMAQMLEDLRPQTGHRVLEVGAGTGYNAALLAHAVTPGEVISVDVDREVLSEAWDHVRRVDARAVRLQHADGREGWASSAPYDRIMVTAAAGDLEPTWLEQLRPGGLLLVPLALAPGLGFTLCGTVRDGEFVGRLTRAAYFMPLRAEGEAGPSDLESVVPAGELRRLPAPWAGWFDRRSPRAGWLGFAQSLAFLGWLRGLQIHYRTTPQRQPSFGISHDLHLCWLGLEEWHVNDAQGVEIGESLWQAFLEAGGPWPTEYRLRARCGQGAAEAGEYYRRGADSSMVEGYFSPGSAADLLNPTPGDRAMNRTPVRGETTCRGI